MSSIQSSITSITRLTQLGFMTTNEVLPLAKLHSYPLSTTYLSQLGHFFDMSTARSGLRICLILYKLTSCKRSTLSKPQDERILKRPSFPMSHSKMCSSTSNLIYPLSQQLPVMAVGSQA